jgi:hypothetical protein
VETDWREREMDGTDPMWFSQSRHSRAYSKEPFVIEYILILLSTVAIRTTLEWSYLHGIDFQEARHHPLNFWAGTHARARRSEHPTMPTWAGSSCVLVTVPLCHVGWCLSRHSSQMIQHRRQSLSLSTGPALACPFLRKRNILL